jgi:hypothetical protein
LKLKRLKNACGHKRSRYVLQIELYRPFHLQLI